MAQASPARAPTVAIGVDAAGLAERAPDMIAQHRLLNEVSAMIDGGLIVTTAARELSPINAANLIKAHAQIESGTTIGKVVLAGW